MKSIARLTLGIALLLSTSICAEAAGTLVRMSDNTTVELAQFAQDAAKADAVFVGDIHDDSALHARQLEIIKALYSKNPQLAIGLEMFASDSQRYLDDWSAGRLPEQDFSAIYARNWSYDWRLYREIFLFARDNRIPMIALNVPKQLIGKVVRLGSKALTESERKELPPGNPFALNPRQAEYLKRIREQAFGNAPARFPSANFDEAQALRNHVMAYRIAKFREKSPKSTVVALTGTWHSIRNGAPESLAEYGKYASRVVLPDLREFSWLKPTVEDLDYLIPRGE